MNTNNSDSIIHILGTTDDAFSLPYGVMLTSLFENNSTSHFCVWIIADTLSPQNLLYIKETVESYGAEFKLLILNNGCYSHLLLNEKDRYSKACYYCLFAADLLPDSISKVLYLDGDIIVLTDIRELWFTNLDNAAIAGVTDFNYEKHTKRLNMSSNYINSGVLLLNLDYQRKNNIVDKFKERLMYMDKHQDEIVFPDQDIFNYVCDNKIVYLPIRYNLLTPFLLERVILNDLEDANGIVDITKCIIHYAGYPKPWNFHYYDHPLMQEWRYYYKKSKWNKVKTEKIQLWKYFLFPLLRILYNFRIIKKNTRFKNRTSFLVKKIYENTN